MRILIADYSIALIEKMKQIIADNFSVIMISEVSDEDDLMRELSQHNYDVLVLALELSEGSALTVLKKIKTISPELPVLVVSMFPVQQYEESVFRAGAHGYVSKVNLFRELISALHQIIQGKKYFRIQDSVDSGEKS